MTIILATKPSLVLVLFTGIAIVMLLTPFETFASSNLKQIQSETTDFPGSDPSAVEVQVTVAKKDTLGDYHVKGSIKNLGEAPLQYVMVTGHFLDESNKTVGVTSCCYTTPSDIEAGRTATFDSFVMKDDISDIPTSFRLSFDWN